MELSTNSLVGLFIDRSSPGVWIVSPRAKPSSNRTLGEAER